jgi:hypothetical protein
MLAQASGQRSRPYPPEVLEWQRQVNSLFEQGNYQEAIRIQEKELAWTEQNLGPDHPDTAASLNNRTRSGVVTPLRRTARLMAHR